MDHQWRQSMFGLRTSAIPRGVVKILHSIAAAVSNSTMCVAYNVYSVQYAVYRISDSLLAVTWGWTGKLGDKFQGWERAVKDLTWCITAP